MNLKSLFSVGFYSKHLIVPYGTTQLRCLQPAEYLKSRGYEVKTGTIYRNIPKKNELLILHRPLDDKYTKAYTAYAKALGIPVLYDTDDLLFDAHAFKYLVEIGKKRENTAEQYRTQLEACDHVIVATSYLAKEASKYNHNVKVIRNALSFQYIKKSSLIASEKNIVSDKKNVTIAYLSGSRSHDRDFQIVEGVLHKLLQEYQNVKVLVVGPLIISESFIQYGERFEHREFIPYQEFAGLFKEIDINIVPLDITNQFNHAKSELKYIEAGACMVPSVVSATETHVEVIKDGNTGLIAYDSRQWYDYLSMLVKDSEKRIRLGSNARKQIIAEYHPEVRAQEWDKFLVEMNREYRTEPYRLRKRMVIDLKFRKEFISRLSMRVLRKF